MPRTSPRKVRATCLAYRACTGRRRCPALVAREGCSIVRLVEQVHPEVLERAISLTLATAASRERPSPPGGDSIEDPLVESQPGLASPVCVHNVDLLVVALAFVGGELLDARPVRVHDAKLVVA